MNLLLCGPPYSGKTSVGRQLSIVLKRPFVDIDDMIEAKVGCSKSVFFRAEGREAFRQCEREILESLPADRKAVISLGGGCLEESLRALGTVVYLSADPQVLWQRLQGLGRMPAYLKAGATFDDFLEHIDKRLGLYQKIADIVVDASGDVEHVVEEIGARYGIE